MLELARVSGGRGRERQWGKRGGLAAGVPSGGGAQVAGGKALDSPHSLLPTSCRMQGKRVVGAQGCKQKPETAGGKGGGKAEMVGDLLPCFLLLDYKTRGFFFPMLNGRKKSHLQIKYICCIDT